MCFAGVGRAQNGTDRSLIYALGCVQGRSHLAGGNLHAVYGPLPAPEKQVGNACSLPRCIMQKGGAGCGQKEECHAYS
ncbi:hypothetical protein AA19596_0792 [Acetobacter fabarum DSM 19596]|nr:hypothetical protein AA19596_0792 [Acetobacter fabarum DSM 19596]